VPSAIAESNDGVMYLSSQWPSMAAYDSVTGELLMYYDYTDGIGGPQDIFSSASISGDGQWLIAYAQSQSLVIQWRITTNITVTDRSDVRVPHKPGRVAGTVKLAEQ